MVLRTVLGARDTNLDLDKMESVSWRSGHLPGLKAGEAPAWRRRASAAEGPIVEPRLGVCQGKNRKRLEKAKERGSTV